MELVEARYSEIVSMFKSRGLEEQSPFVIPKDNLSCVIVE